MLKDYQKNFFTLWLPPAVEYSFRLEQHLLIKRTLRFGMILGSVVFWAAYFAAFFFLTDNRNWLLSRDSLVPQALLILGYASSFIDNRYRQYMYAWTPLFVGVFAYSFLSAMKAIMPPELYAGVHTTFIAILIVSYFFEKLNPLIALATGLGCTVVYFYLIGRLDVPGLTAPQKIFHLAVANLTGFVICYANARADRIKFLLEGELRFEKKQSEEVLNRILPLKIANRVRLGENRIADLIPEVSVLFADLVGFTPLASQWKADRVVDFLDDLFVSFDKKAAEYGVEKIKTIGDSYMAATGFTGSDLTHGQRIAEFALSMRAIVNEMNVNYDCKVDLRIGIHSGSVVAGVIGQTRFGYDLWGDTVNVASRMESTAGVGSIQISDATKQLLGSRFNAVDQRVIDVKGKGPVTVWTLAGVVSTDDRAAA